MTIALPPLQLFKMRKEDGPSKKNLEGRLQQVRGRGGSHLAAFDDGNRREE